MQSADADPMASPAPGRARARREHYRRSDARKVGWLVGLVQAQHSHHTAPVSGKGFVGELIHLRGEVASLRAMVHQLQSALAGTTDSAPVHTSYAGDNVIFEPATDDVSEPSQSMVDLAELSARFSARRGIEADTSDNGHEGGDDELRIGHPGDTAVFRPSAQEHAQEHVQSAASRLGARAKAQTRSQPLHMAGRSGVADPHAAAPPSVAGPSSRTQAPKVCESFLPMAEQIQSASTVEQKLRLLQSSRLAKGND